MKKIAVEVIYKKMLLVMIGILLSSANVLYAGGNYISSYVVLNFGISNQYYDCFLDTSNDDFNNYNFGTFKAIDDFVLNGAEVNVWEDNSHNIAWVRMFYRIYKTGTTPPSFSQIDLDFRGKVGNDEKWDQTAENINVLAGLGQGDYTFEVYFHTRWEKFEDDFEIYDNNDNQNYKANFTVEPNQSLGSGNWSEIDWSYGVSPASSHPTEINTAHSVNIASNGQVSVANLNVEGQLTIKSDVSGTGSLIINGTVTGDITAERYIPAANWATGTDGWHLLSSPVASQAITGGWTPDGTSSNNYDFYAWNEANNIWVNFKNTTTSPTWAETNGNSNFTVGRGYVVAYQAESTNTFTGTPNKDDVVVNTLTRTTGAYADADDAGFNVLGNPFPSAIKWNDENWTLTGISTTAKLWNSTDKSYDDLGVNGIIPANNGFVVQLTTGTTGSITIPKASRTHDATNWQKSGDQNKIKLIAREADNNSAQSSNIVLNAAASENYDPQVDATFLGGYAPMFYSKKDDHHLSTYALASVSDDLTIPYGFVSNGASEYAIELTENIDGQTIYLTDLITNTTHNLSENPVYSFTASSGDSPDRFLLHFGVVGIGEQDQTSTLNAYTYNNRLYVNNSLEKAQLAVYDLQGRLLMQQSANSNGLQSLPLDLKAGVYVVRLSNAQEAMSVKINVQ